MPCRRILQSFAVGNAWLGRFEQARAFVRQHERLWREGGRETPTELAGVVELWAGNPGAAEASVRPVVEAQQAHGDLGHGAASLAVLARAVLELYERKGNLVGARLAREFVERNE